MKLSNYQIIKLQIKKELAPLNFLIGTRLNKPSGKSRNYMGFTLLELLVVISIIGILIAIGSASYSTAQKKGRDSRRQADLKAAQNAFEQYYSVNSSAYPATCENPDHTITVVGIISIVDPKNTGVYLYDCDTCTTTAYSCHAHLEDGTTFTITNLQ